ncbi:hypothetical protein B0H17DRAFT_1261759 [Mycena rosella]|uniref:Uncharacterized protein n=1 Tax=Mycena rosella TaxID=1033263 RepID=A0AAD7CR67_MYCRO|nr:hypothetical protein B0H17DRAFT_1261759 [Mycena rosella]
MIICRGGYTHTRKGCGALRERKAGSEGRGEGRVASTHLPLVGLLSSSTWTSTRRPWVQVPPRRFAMGARLPTDRPRLGVSGALAGMAATYEVVSQRRTGGRGKPRSPSFVCGFGTLVAVFSFVTAGGGHRNRKTWVKERDARAGINMHKPTAEKSKKSAEGWWPGFHASGAENGKNGKRHRQQDPINYRCIPIGRRLGFSRDKLAQITHNIYYFEADLVVLESIQRSPMFCSGRVNARQCRVNSAPICVNTALVRISAASSLLILLGNSRLYNLNPGDPVKPNFWDRSHSSSTSPPCAECLSMQLNPNLSSPDPAGNEPNGSAKAKIRSDQPLMQNISAYCNSHDSEAVWKMP